MSTKATVKRSLGAAILVLVSVVIYLWASAYSLERPTAGPWRTHTKNLDTDCDRGFRFIDNQTGFTAESGDGLKFYYSWPRQKWLSFSMLPGKQPRLAILDPDPSGNSADLQVYTIKRDLYADFLKDFDDNSSGYRLTSSGFDGESFAYERWTQGSAMSYYGNASFSSKDGKLYRLVGEMVAKVRTSGSTVR
ncbi:MAG: hypothetical protein P4N59_05055 [Negativicutes bacterium]|nr:hypothetical protein [Negativicutes bacterium]